MVFTKLADGVCKRFPADDGGEIAVLFAVSATLSFVGDEGHLDRMVHTLLPLAMDNQLDF